MSVFSQVAEKILRAAAPTLLTALGGPLGGLAAAVATAALDAWLGPAEPGPDGRRPDATPDEIARAIEANAADERFREDLRKAEADLKALEQRMRFRFAALEQKDRADARAATRESGLARPQFYAGVGLVVVALVMLFGVIIGCILAFTGAITLDPALFGLIGTIVGIFQAIAVQVIGFYYGSSAGSKDKADQISTTLQDLGLALSARMASPQLVVLPPSAPGADWLRPPPPRDFPGG
jgi:hypothetical protein